MLDAICSAATGSVYKVIEADPPRGASRLTVQAMLINHIMMLSQCNKSLHYLNKGAVLCVCARTAVNKCTVSHCHRKYLGDKMS